MEPTTKREREDEKKEESTPKRQKEEDEHVVWVIEYVGDEGQDWGVSNITSYGCACNIDAAMKQIIQDLADEEFNVGKLDPVNLGLKPIANKYDYAIARIDPDKFTFEHLSHKCFRETFIVSVRRGSVYLLGRDLDVMRAEHKRMNEEAEADEE